MVIEMKGYCGVHVEYKGRKHYLPLLVAKGDGPNLLGRNWFRPLGFALVEAEGVNRVTDVSDIYNLVKTFSAVSSPTIGCYKGSPVHIHVDSSKPPKYHRARDVKLPLVSKMIEGIESNVSRGIWVPITESKWASGLVPVPKQDGKLRLCADYKATVNPAISADIYKSPSTDAVLDKLGGGKYFAELDLAEAYTQIPVDEETAHLLAVNTVRGLHKVTRLPFGIKVAPGIFQRIMDGLLGGIPNVVVYQDNIYIKSESIEGHKASLSQVLKILSEAGFTVNAPKCTWIATELRVLGFRVSDKGVHPCEDKVQAIKLAPAPGDKDQLASLIGLISFYERFFQGKAHILEPLQRLLDAATEWRWDSKHQAALDLIKDRISSDQVLMHYSLDKPVAVICDASPYGVGAILCHTVIGPTGVREERPVRFASRTLTPTERRYSQLDKEALALMFAVKKFARYLYGRKFLLVTDHKPLVSIFNPNADIPDNMSPRMTRWAVALSALDYRIQHRPGAEIGHADFLSRHPLPQEQQQDMYSEPAGIFLLEAKTPEVLNASSIADETSRDPLLSRVMDWVINGWPTTAPKEAGAYEQKKLSLSCSNGCLLYGDRVVIPPALRPAVCQLIHATHPGISCSKEIAHSIVWWPRVTKDVEAAVRRCEPCQLAANRPKRAKYSPWPAPQKPWDRVHLDYAGPFLGHHFFIAIDSYSKWPVIKAVPNLSSKVLISTLRAMFADFGKPTTIVSDNGSNFIAADTIEFLEKNGIKFLNSPPWHPASNGLAERTVQTFKRLMDKFRDGDISTRLARTQWAMRTRPSSSTGKSPATLFMGREFRTHLSQLHPKDQDHPRVGSSSHNPFAPKAPVWALKHYANKTVWVPGEVGALRGARACDVRLQEGGSLDNIHVDHLRPRTPAVAEETTPAPGVETPTVQAPEQRAEPVQEAGPSPPTPTPPSSPPVTPSPPATPTQESPVLEPPVTLASPASPARETPGPQSQPQQVPPIPTQGPSGSRPCPGGRGRAGAVAHGATTRRPVRTRFGRITRPRRPYSS